MSQVIKLKKGLDIRLQGGSPTRVDPAAAGTCLCAETGRFSKGVILKMLVRVDDVVKAGTPLFYDKYRPQVLFTSAGQREGDRHKPRG